MPNVDLKLIDETILRCLLQAGSSGRDGLSSTDLTPLLQHQFPDNDEVAMRQGEALTRLRGRGLVDMDENGAIHLTAEGKAQAHSPMPEQ